MDFPLIEESVEVRGVTFRVRELTMDQLLPLTGEGIADSERSKLILQASVTLDGGLPVDAGALPSKVFATLSAVVTRVNGLGESDEPGNA